MSDLDRYYTPDAVAAQFVKWAGVSGQRVLEPNCGGGALVRAAFAAGAPNVTAIDIQNGTDFLKQVPQSSHYFDLVLMNPPYSKGRDFKHVRHALGFAPRVCALVKLDFLAGVKRSVLAPYYTRVCVFVRRPQFVGPDSNNMSPARPFCFIELSSVHDGGPATIEWV